MSEKTGTPDAAVIFDHLKKLDYLFFKGKIKTWKTEQVVGWNCASSSIFRKELTLSRLEKFIEKNNIPVFIEDQTPYSERFKIMIRL